MERWKGYFEKLLKEKFGWYNGCLTVVNAVSGPVELLSHFEVKSAIKSAKADDPPGVVAKMLRASGDMWAYRKAKSQMIRDKVG